MCTATEHIPINQTERIKDALMAQLKESKQTGPQDGHPVILRAEVHVEGLKALPWLCAQNPTSRGYWSNRDEPFELAGVGAADMITGDSDLDYNRLMGMLHKRLATAQGNPRYLGGMCFYLNGSRDEAWGHFKAYRFILPRFEVVARNGTAIFACNMLSNEDLGVVRKAYSHVVFPEAQKIPTLPKPISRHDHPDEEGWRTNVEAALGAFESGNI